MNNTKVDDISIVSKESWEKDSDDEDAVVAIRLWSECLRSRERPGMGIRLCCDRSRQLSQGSRDAANILLETSKHYGSYAEALLKAGRILKPASTCSDKSILSLQQLIVARANAYHQFAKKAQASDILPLQNYLITHGDSTNQVQERYQTSQSSADRMRRRALKAQTACTTIHNDTNEALRNWMEVKAGEKEKENYDLNDSLLAQIPKEISNMLLQVQRSEVKYKRIVQAENDCVRQIQRLEVMALETVQKLEEDRLLIFTHSLVKLFRLVRKQVVVKEAPVPESETNPLKARSSTFSNIASQAEDPEQSGSKETSELDLPVEIGKLRNTVRSKVATCARFVDLAEMLSECLQAVGEASTNFESAITDLIHRSDSIADSNSFDSIRAAMVSTEESLRIITLWDRLSDALKLEVNLARSLVLLLQKISKETLEPILVFGTSVLKPAAERDNATFKQLCHAARSRGEAEVAHRDVTTQAARVRDRCKSVDGDGNSITSSANKQFSQSLADLFAILPNGGEHAMRVLDATTRASVAQISLEEVGQKEVKVSAAQSVAKELTSLSMDAYKASAEAALKECSLRNDFLADFSTIFHPIRSHVAGSHLSFGKVFQDNGSILAPSISTGIPTALNDWSSRIEKHMLAEEMSSSTSSPTESMLEVQLNKSDVVQKALSHMEAVLHDESVDISESNADEIEAETVFETCTAPPSPTRDRTGSAASLLGFQRNGNEDSTAGWLLRSLTMSERSDTIFGKLGKKKASIRRRLSFDDVNAETVIFAEIFWPREVDPTSIPTIANSFACSFRDGKQRLPFQYGRVFISDHRLSFVGWSRKQLSLKWSEVVAIEPALGKLRATDDEIVVRCRRGSVEDSFMILAGFFNRQKTLDALEETRQKANTPLDESAVNLQAMPTPEKSASAVVKEDETVKKMHEVLSGTLRNISVNEFFGIVWAETKPFYKPWLEKECFDVSVGSWIKEDVEGPWCGERYTQRREVRFKVKRKTHLYIGPPIADVMQTHYCRFDDDECVVQMRVNFDGIPYSDTFAVEIRWVARRDGQKDLRVDVGVEIDFKKSTFLKSKIRSGTLEETAPVHKDLFEAVKKACASASGVELPEEVQETDQPTTVESLAVTSTNETGFRIYIFGFLGCFLVLLFFGLRIGTVKPEANDTIDAYKNELGALSSRMDSLEIEIKEIKTALHDILAILKEQN